MEEILHQFNPWWGEEYDSPGIPRDEYLDTLAGLWKTRDIVLLAGLRRVGKTTLMHQLVHTLLREGVEPRHLFYVSLDNLALKDLSISEVVEAYRKARSLKHDERAVLFLDEVHFKENWELELKNLYDMGHVKVFASGSASLDIVMKSPNLTGRQRLVRVRPLDFGEFLDFTGRRHSMADAHLMPGLAREYVERGGLPEYVLTKDPNVLQSLLDSILYRDIAGRYEIRNRENLKDVLALLAQGVSSTMSHRKISRTLGAKEETVARVINLFVESGLVHVIEKEGKANERKASPRKIYLADTGLLSMLTEKVNIGARVENLVYLTLARTGDVRYHRSDGTEVDFVRKKEAWESKYRNDISDEDTAPILGLRGYKRRVLITDEAEGERDGVKLVPLWKFLLNNGGM